MFDPRIEVVERVVFPKDDSKAVEFTFKGGSCWQGSKLKDFCGKKDKEWDKIIKIGSQIRLWTVSWSIVLGFEVYNNGWESVWCKANNFQTKKESYKASKAYSDFIIKEGDKIAGLIDEGLTLKQIDKAIDQGHSGNTHAWALKIGISKATNKENADKVRIEFNKEWGVSEDKPGIVNPAIMTMNVKA